MQLVFEMHRRGTVLREQLGEFEDRGQPAMPVPATSMSVSLAAPEGHTRYHHLRQSAACNPHIP
jgi:hypothetical protein